MQNSVDLTNCDREPIHIPGSIQPHGILLTVQEPELTILQMSENAAAALGRPGEPLVGQTLSALFLPEDLVTLKKQLLSQRLDASPRYLVRLRQTDAAPAWAAVAHRFDEVLVIELEQRQERDAHAAADLHAALQKTVAELDAIEGLADFCQCAADHLREFTGFDRVMVYQFHQDGHGSVIAEAKDASLDPYLGLHYPASDIPAQARQLYLRNPFRLTADVDAKPVPVSPGLNPKTGRPLDMSFCALRSTSPIHLEYLRNMGVAASLSFSILRYDPALHHEQLWGLFACHHRRPKMIPQEVRITGEILARLVGLQVGIKEQAAQRSYAAALQSARRELVDRLAQTGDFASTFVHGDRNLLSDFQATGAALRTSSKTFLLGDTPDLEVVQELSSWLDRERAETVWATDSLPAEYEPARSFAKRASGLLAMRVAAGSPEAVFWFRPEVIETVNWAGDPHKPVQQGANGQLQLHPRKSFAVWQEQVSGTSEPWQEIELEHARLLRESMSDALLRHRASEIARLNAELTRSNQELEYFASLASHDLQEPLRTVSAYTQLLTRSVPDSASDEAKKYGALIVDATQRMRSLIQSLLEYARLGRGQKTGERVSIKLVVETALSNLKSSIEQTGARIETEELPDMVIDAEQLVRVFQNVIGNAIKYRKPDISPVINLKAQKRAGEWLFSVEDNGMGFDPKYSERIFESFERLHGGAQSGTGLGLAICRKIIENHGGTMWAEGRPGAGATFYFTVPSRD